jgi:hypothetical protein
LYLYYDVEDAAAADDETGDVHDDETVTTRMMHTAFVYQTGV